jgi:HEAT repeat protein
MAEQPNEETINKLLEELHSSEAYRRKSAIETIAELKIDDEKIVSALKAAAANDANRVVRQEARKALIALGVEPPPASEPPAQSAPQPALYKNRDFWIGFIGWPVINIPVSFFGSCINLGEVLLIKTLTI